MLQRWSFLGAVTTALILIGIAIFWYSRTTASGEETFRLGEFGVELTVSRALARDLSRTTARQEGVGDVVHITSSAFRSGDTACPLGVFYKIDKDSIASSQTSWTEETLEMWQAAQGEEPARVKQFTDFYLVFEPSDSTCTDDADEITAEEEAKRNLAGSLGTARYIQY